MVNEAKLSAVLGDFARTVITDFPIQGILDHLVERIADLMPITAAGVTLIGAENRPRYIAASDESALRFERLQSECEEGPCLEAYATGEPVTIPDLAVDDRFPRFAPAAVAAGLGAVFTFPLRHGDAPIGALDLYRTSPGALDQHDMEAAQTLADVATAYLLNAQARDDATAASLAHYHNSLHDPLTGLANRKLLAERLDHAADRAKRTHTSAAVLFVDLDKFKDINDRHGHHAGDALLLAVTDRLVKLVRAGDTLARVSGDEFVIFCEDMSSPADAELLAQRIGTSLDAPFAINGRSLSITASVGIAYAGPGQDITQQLVVTADMAMYEVKRRGGAGHQVADPRETRTPISEDQLESDLRLALVADELDVAYQPIVRTCDRAIAGVEALVRWEHPSHGEVEPLTTVAIAERTDLIDDLGCWVLRRACRDHRSWMVEHPGLHLDLSVNVSVRQLLRPDFASLVAKTLVDSDTDPEALILEVTESIFIGDHERVADVLHDVHRLGVRIALDDYGTGFSSLHYLARLPVHILKIDRCFITDLGNASGRIIVASVNTLAHDLGLQVVAEGIETREQHHAINVIGCDLAQGFLYDRPMPASAIDSLLATRVLQHR